MKTEGCGRRMIKHQPEITINSDLGDSGLNDLSSEARQEDKVPDSERKLITRLTLL